MNQYQIWVGAQGSPGGIPELESFLGALGVTFRLQDHGMGNGILLAFYCFIIENNVHEDLKNKFLLYLRQIHLCVRRSERRWWSSHVTFVASVECQERSSERFSFLIAWFWILKFMYLRSCYFPNVSKEPVSSAPMPPLPPPPGVSKAPSPSSKVEAADFWLHDCADWNKYCFLIEFKYCTTDVITKNRYIYIYIFQLIFPLGDELLQCL